MRRRSKVLLVVLVLGLVAGGVYLRLRTPASNDGGDTGRSSPPGQPLPSSPATADAATEDFAPRFAEKLAALAVRDNLMASATGNVVRFDMDAIQLDTRVEHERPAGEKRGIGIAVGATIPDGDGTFHFISGAIGVGRTRAEAIEQAIGGWLGLSGVALLEAVPKRAVSTVAIPFGNLVAYPGSLAVRGETDLHWTAKRDKELLTAVAPALTGLSPASSHSVAITVVVLGGGALDGQCLVDNRASEELCKLAMKFDWTASAEGYLARQLYLLRPRVAAPATKTRDVPAAPPRK